jgi:hypothetical protein
MEIGEIVTINEKKFQVTHSLADKTDKKRKTSFWVAAFAIILFVAVLVTGFVVIRSIFPPMCIPITIWSFVILVGGYVAYLFVHELLRGLLFIFSRSISIKDLSFGVIVRAGAVYCISKVPVKIAHMRVVLLLPFIIVSLPLLAYSIIVGDVIFLIGAALSLTIVASDLWLLGTLRKHKGAHFLLEDKAAQDSEVPSGYILKETT